MRHRSNLHLRLMHRRPHHWYKIINNPNNNSKDDNYNNSSCGALHCGAEWWRYLQRHAVARYIRQCQFKFNDLPYEQSAALIIFCSVVARLPTPVNQSLDPQGSACVMESIFQRGRLAGRIIRWILWIDNFGKQEDTLQSNGTCDSSTKCKTPGSAKGTCEVFRSITFLNPVIQSLFTFVKPPLTVWPLGWWGTTFVTILSLG